MQISKGTKNIIILLEPEETQSGVVLLDPSSAAFLATELWSQAKLLLVEQIRDIYKKGSQKQVAQLQQSLPVVQWDGITEPF